MEIHLKFWLNIYHKRCWFIRKLHTSGTEQKIKFFIKDFFSKFDQIRMKLRIWSHLLKKSFMKNFIFCAVWNTRGNLINITIYYIILGPFYPAHLAAQWFGILENILPDMRQKFHLLFKDYLTNFHNSHVEENSLPPGTGKTWTYTRI